MITLYTAKQICSVIVHSTAKFTINSILSVIKGQQLLSPSIEYCYLTLNLLNLESEPIAGYPQVSRTFAVQVTLQLVDNHYFLLLCNERNFKSLTQGHRTKTCKLALNTSLHLICVYSGQTLTTGPLSVPDKSVHHEPRKIKFHIVIIPGDVQLYQ